MTKLNNILFYFSIICFLCIINCEMPVEKKTYPLKQISVVRIFNLPNNSYTQVYTKTGLYLNETGVESTNKTSMLKENYKFIVRVNNDINNYFPMILEVICQIGPETEDNFIVKNLVETNPELEPDYGCK